MDFSLFCFAWRQRSCVYRKQIIYFILFLVSSSLAQCKELDPIVSSCRSFNGRMQANVFALRVISVLNYSEMRLEAHATVNPHPTASAAAAAATKHQPNEKRLNDFLFRSRQNGIDTREAVQRLNGIFSCFTCLHRVVVVSPLSKPQILITFNGF